MEQLKLEKQLCFPLYTASRLVIRSYTPLLNQLGVTYPQYLVLLILWETDEVTVGDITRKLYLDTSTITPLLKRLEKMSLITRVRSTTDERKVTIKLTDKGQELKMQACTIPEQLMRSISFSLDEAMQLQQLLQKFIKATV
jgi:DNA-binding MarR family transcriptional regulator